MSNEQVTREDLIFPFQVASAMLAYVIFLVVLPCLAIFFSFWRGWLMHLLAISCIIASLLCVPLTIGAFAVQCTRFGIEDTSVPHTSPDQGITKDQYRLSLLLDGYLDYIGIRRFPAHKTDENNCGHGSCTGLSLARLLHCSRQLFFQCGLVSETDRGPTVIVGGDRAHDMCLPTFLDNIGIGGIIPI